MAIVSLIRHGQASFGAADYDQLSPLGEQQLQHLGATFAAQEETVDIVVRGSLRRHQQSCAAFLQGYGKPVSVQEIAQWNEFDHRAVMRALAFDEPQLRQLFAANGAAKIPEREVLALFLRSITRWQSGAHDDDYAETWPAFVQRVQQAWQQLHGLAGHERIVVITSGGPIALSAMDCLGMPATQMMSINQHLVNSGISRFFFKPERGARLLSLNEHYHVSGKFSALLTYR